MTKEKEETNTVGRPSKYKPEMCDKVIELMTDGASKYEVCAELEICFDTISEWCNPEGEYFKRDFSDSVKKGLDLSRAWWEKQGRTNLKDKDFSYTGWYMNMKNRFGWADKQVVENNNNNLNTDTKDLKLTDEDKEKFSNIIISSLKKGETIN